MRDVCSTRQNFEAWRQRILWWTRYQITTVALQNAAGHSKQEDERVAIVLEISQTASVEFLF